MYSAICPDCGKAIQLPMPGGMWADCPHCLFYGWVPPLAQPTPQPPTTPQPTPSLESYLVMGGYAAGTNMRPLIPPTSPAPQPATTAQRNRQVASLDISVFADAVYETLLALLQRTRPLPTLPAAWERLQVALETLHRALGGAHMGEYAPDMDAVGDAIVAVTVAQLAALEAAGQMCGSEA